MLSVLVVLVISGVLAGAQEPSLPTPEQVVTRYVQALAGQETLSKITSRGALGSISVPTFGSFGSYEEIAQAPNKLIRIFRVPGYGVIQRCFDGERAWAEDPEYGVEDLTGARLSELRRLADFQPGLTLMTNYSSLSVKRRTNVNEREAFEVIRSSPEGAQTYWFDVQTGLLLGIESIETARDGSSRAVRMFFEDYRSVGGIQEPHLLRYESPEYLWTVRRQIAHNIPVDPAKFRKP